MNKEKALKAINKRMSFLALRLSEHPDYSWDKTELEAYEWLLDERASLIQKVEVLEDLVRNEEE